MITNDPAVIERIEADDYTYVMEGMKGGKQGDVEQAKSHAYAGTCELSQMQARVFGDAAIVTGKAALREAKYNGKDVSGDYLFTDVFVKRNGQWQVAASHSSRVHGGM
ncbi:MAG: nuclear transport factor 2 family protein [Bryobacteraceae bacterium]